MADKSLRDLATVLSLAYTQSLNPNQLSHSLTLFSPRQPSRTFWLTAWKSRAAIRWNNCVPLNYPYPASDLSLHFYKPFSIAYLFPNLGIRIFTELDPSCIITQIRFRINNSDSYPNNSDLGPKKITQMSNIKRKIVLFSCLLSFKYSVFLGVLYYLFWVKPGNTSNFGSAFCSTHKSRLRNTEGFFV